MPDAHPLCLAEVLEEEYQALRSESSYTPSEPHASEPARLAELFQKVHRQPRPFSALCISGGGIRSATFALGALQGMADRGFLGEFDYLSTVSGGGYIGGWLTAWIQRAKGMSNVAPKLKPKAPKPVPPEADPIQHLRDYNNYLTPKLGFLSTDTWTIAATVIRNMALNWLVLVPLLLFALMIPRLMVSLVALGDQVPTPPPFEWAWVMKATLFLVYALFSLAVFNTVRYLPAVGGVPHTQGHFLLFVLAPLVTSYALHCAYYWWSPDVTTFWQEVVQGLIESFAGWFAFLLVYVAFRNPKKCFRLLFGPITIAMFLVGVGVGVFCWILLVKIYPAASIETPQFVALGPSMMLLGFALAGALFVGLTSSVLKDEDREWFSRAGGWLTLVILIWGGICSLVLILPELMFAAPVWARSVVTFLGGASGWAASMAGLSDKSKAVQEQTGPRTESWQMSLAVKLAPPVFVVLFFVGLSILTSLILDKTGLVASPWWDHRGVVEKSNLLASSVVGTAFLLLSLVMARYININLFSLNSMYRNRLIRAYLGASNPKRHASLFTGFAENDNLRMHAIDTAYKPFHVLNLTLNLVAGERLAWQQRKAESFTVSPLHCGASDLGYRPSAKYGQEITLGMAMAVSGAAASPNMGYHSSPVVGFIMTLFNARLGAWLGNPGKHGSKAWRQRGPRTATGSLIREAFGLTNSQSPYVYLSDGGHFENLGLYEMVARRCRYIVVLDSGADPEFNYEDLGNALRKIRIDMNIPIEFDEGLISPLQTRKKRCAVARIVYSSVDGNCDDGYLIYIKPMFLANEPPDVQSYHCAHTDFPHQSTANQWFDESQTESYRLLGLHTVNEVFQHFDGTSLEDVRRAAENYVKSAVGKGHAP